MRAGAPLRKVCARLMLISVNSALRVALAAPCRHASARDGMGPLGPGSATGRGRTLKG